MNLSTGTTQLHSPGLLSTFQPEWTEFSALAPSEVPKKKKKQYFIFVPVPGELN